MCLSGRCSICRDKEKGRAAELRGEALFFRVEMDEDLIEDCVRRDDHLRIYDDLTRQLAEVMAERDAALAMATQKIKPLIWAASGHHGQALDASAFGLKVFYRIDGRPGNWTLTSAGETAYVHAPGFATRADAQAVAAADYEKRMMAQMAPEDE